MPVSDEIVFALNSSVVDLRNRSIPNFQRSSPIYLESEVNGSFTLSPVPGNVFAVSDVDGSFYVEPSGSNLLTFNIDLSQPVWEKGSNVNVTPDAAPAPDASFLADRVTWLPSNLGGSPQLLRRLVALSPGKTYQFWGLLQPISGAAGTRDVLRLTSFDGTTTYHTKSLAELNNYLGRYRLFHTTFVSPGEAIDVPQLRTPNGLVAVTPSTFTIALSGLAADQLAGSFVSFGNNTSYRVVSHTATDGSGNVVVTVEGSALVANGVTTSSVASFAPPPDVQCWLEFYCESLFSVNFGGLFLERSDYRTSAIYQRESLIARSSTLLEWQPKDNVLAGRSSFAVYFDLLDWRGNGSLLDFGDLDIYLENNRLSVKAGATIVSDTADLPKAARCLVVSNPETASLSLFVNGILRAKQSLSGFTPTLKPFKIGTNGVRRYQEIVVFGRALSDGTPAIGAAGAREVAEVFAASPVPASMIAGHLPRLLLPTVTIPAAPSDTANTAISAINTGTRTLTVGSITGFANGDAVSVVRGPDRTVIVYAQITSAPTGTSIVLDTVAGIQPGDRLVKAATSRVRRVFQRFPVVPSFAPQPVLSINSGLKRISVASALSFTPDMRILIQTNKYQDVVEALVTSRDTVNNFLFLSSVDGIEVGHVAFQVYSETLIPPSMYVASYLQEVNGVRVEQKASNGVVLTNSNPFDVEITPYVTVVS
jgi:hypothetical protein